MCAAAQCCARSAGGADADRFERRRDPHVQRRREREDQLVGEHAPHQFVPEPVAVGAAGFEHAVPNRVLQHRCHLRERPFRNGREERRFESAPDDRGVHEQVAIGCAEVRETFRDDGPRGQRNVAVDAQTAVLERHREQLFGEQRVAFREVFDLREDLGRDARAARRRRALQEMARLVAREPREPHGRGACARRGAAHAGELALCGGIVEPVRDGDEDLHAPQLAEHIREQLQGPRIGPVHVLEHDDERLAQRFACERGDDAFEVRARVPGRRRRGAAERRHATACARLQPRHQRREGRVRPRERPLAAGGGDDNVLAEPFA